MINYYAGLSDYKRGIYEMEGLDSGGIQDQDETEEVESPLVHWGQPS